MFFVFTICDCHINDWSLFYYCPPSAERRSLESPIKHSSTPNVVLSMTYISLCMIEKFHWYIYQASNLLAVFFIRSIEQQVVEVWNK